MPKNNDVHAALMAIDEMTENLRKRNEDVFLVREEYVDPGLFRGPPTYLIHVYDYDESLSKADILGMRLEDVRVGLKFRSFTNFSADGGRLFGSLTAPEVADRLLRLRGQLAASSVEPPGKPRRLIGYPDFAVTEMRIDISRPLLPETDNG